MKIYEPSKTPSYIIEYDGGDNWFCHDSNFINVAEDDRCFFSDSPAKALQGFIDKFGGVTQPKTKEDTNE